MAAKCKRLKKEIPEFLQQQLLYCDNLKYRKYKKTCLLLTRDLQFYEFEHKQLLSSIDLRTTCLSKEQRRLEEYADLQGKWYSDHKTLLENSGIYNFNTDQTMPHLDSFDIYFGKYIYKNFDICKLYILIRCWDKLVVVFRQKDPGNFQIIAEYEFVAGFKIIHSNIKYQTLVEIQFENGDKKCTDFQDSNEFDLNVSLSKSKSGFKKLLQQIRCAKTELHLHKVMTQKDFDYLSDRQTFGSNFIRNCNLEDKQLLTRCGDIWIRITVPDLVVIGIPLLSNSKILKNIKPILKIENGMNSGIQYEHFLYQLKQNFPDLETLETFFQSKDEDLQLNNWSVNNKLQLLPGTFGILLIKINILQTIILEQSVPLFLCFEVEKRIPTFRENDENIFTEELQIFLKNLNFTDILIQRQCYEVKFQPKTLHQDFLAIAATSFLIDLSIEFSTLNDLDIFQKLLIEKFNFTKEEVRKKSKLIFKDNDETEVDELKRTFNPDVVFPYILFYNRKPLTLWYGFLVLLYRHIKDELKTEWKFYTKSEEQSFFILKILFNELLLLKCNINKIEYPHRNNKQVETIEFENAIRQELTKLFNLINSKNNEELDKNYGELGKLQIVTDLLATNVK